jgi:hypothetical protein
MSAFLFYSQDKRRMIKAENPGMRNTEISRVLGGMWKKATPEERAPHIQREASQREKYKVAIAQWREKEAIRAREAANDQSAKWHEKTSDDHEPIAAVESFRKASTTPTPPSPQRSPPLPLQPHHRPSSPGVGPAQNYYSQSSYGDYYPPVQSYASSNQYNQYGTYQSQPHPQAPPQPSAQRQNYYQNYGPVHPSDYRPRQYHQDYPSVSRSDSMEETRRMSRSHTLSPASAQYGSYYPPSGLPPGYSDQQHLANSYSEEYPPP